MNLSNLQPEQVWRMVLDQLRLEMTQASFNSWVRDTCFVSFENNLLTLGTANSYASQWLSSRLTSTVTNLLTGIFNRPVSVQFVVYEPPPADNDEPVHDEIPDPNKSPKVLILQAEYQSIYDEIVQPDQVIVVPGYFLRYIPMLGVERSWLYIGFRQAAYEAGASKKPGKQVSAPAKKVAWYAGMSTRSFWRWAAKPATWKLLRWLVQPVDAAPQWKRGSDGRPHQATRNYRVAMSLPLTPLDELHLRSWMYQRLAEGNTPLSVLQSTLETSVEKLLPWPEKMPSLEEISGEPHSVRDVVVDVCGAVAEADRAQFNELTEKLAQHLMPPKDLVFLTHYFVRRWLPQLGSGAGWLVTLLRDRCYLNQRTGEIRDEVRLDQGYAEAARWLGLKRVKTVWEWLRTPAVAVFLLEIGREVGSWEAAPRHIQVRLSEPMTDQDQDQASTILAENSIGASVTHNQTSYPSNGAPVTHKETITTDPVGANGTHNNGKKDNGIGASGTHSTWERSSPIGGSGTHSQEDGSSVVGAGVTHSEEHETGKNGTNGSQSKGSTGPSVGASVTHNGANGTHTPGAPVTPIGGNGTLGWRECHSFNSLTPGSNLLVNTQTTTSAPEDTDQEVVGDWNIAGLLSLNRVNAKNQEWLLGRGITAQTFISWLLYAASPSGRGIRDPIGHAVSRLVKEPAKGAGGAYDRLAGIPPDELAALIQQDLSGQSPWKADWRTAMEGAPRARLRALADQLDIPAPDS